MKASSVAAIARMRVLPNADATSLATGRLVTIEVPKSPLRVTAEPAQVLHRQRLVEAVVLLELVDDLLGRVGRHDGEIGSPGARWTSAKTSSDTPNATGTR